MNNQASPVSKKSWNELTVAITGINAKPESPGPGLAVARSIKEHPEFTGRVIGLGYDVLDAGLYNRQFCDNGYLLPYPFAGEEAFRARIAEIQAKENIDVIIPCLDAELHNFIRMADSLKAMGISTLIPNNQQFLMRSKTNLNDFCRSIQVDTPETKIITDTSFFDSCEENGWQFPLVIKGIFYDAYICYNKVEAKTAFSKLVGTWGFPVLAQRHHSGIEFDICALGDGCGNMLGPVTMRKRGLTEKGKAWAGVTVIEPILTKLAQKIVYELKWTGPIELEFLQSKDGTNYLIEINPRFPAWVYLCQSVGRNLPIAVLKLLCGRKDFNFADASAGTFFIRHAQEIIVSLPEFESVFVHGTSNRNEMPSTNESKNYSHKDQDVKSPANAEGNKEVIVI